MGTPFQQKWLTKLIGYDFLVEYKKGVENRVADALSMKDFEPPDIQLALLSMPTASWVEDLRSQYQEDDALKNLLVQLHRHELDTRKYSLRDNLLLY